jgi:hypothetical protein
MYGKFGPFDNPVDSTKAYSQHLRVVDRICLEIRLVRQEWDCIEDRSLRISPSKQGPLALPDFRSDVFEQADVGCTVEWRLPRCL